jgi:hypothetical protein
MKPLPLLSAAKFVSIISGFAGIIAGILYSFGGLIIDALVTYGYVTTNETPGLSEGTILAFGALIGMPLYFALWGFIIGLVGALTYNLTAKIFHGKPKWFFTNNTIYQ